MPVLVGAWLLLRKSSFVAVQAVQITGVHGAEAPEVQAALEHAARGMSTLAVNTGALQAAVAPLRVVRAVHAVPRFPHGLRIEVTEQLPVAALTVAGVRTAVAADGVVLGPSLLSGSLPTVSGWVVPAPGKSVRGATLLAELTVLGAAPTPIAKHAERVFVGARGLTVAMRNGLLVYFGDATRAHAKWLSLARVLADSGSVGASYVDVRLPGRPAAGFPEGVTPPDASAAEVEASGSTSKEAPLSGESTIESLASRLSSGTAAASGTGTQSGTSTPTGATGTTPEGSESSAGETSSTGEAESSQTTTEPGG